MRELADMTLDEKKLKHEAKLVGSKIDYIKDSLSIIIDAQSQKDISTKLNDMVMNENDLTLYRNRLNKQVNETEVRNKLKIKN